MKKILLTSALAVFALATANAQHLSLFEEFTGENCPPCAATNPGLWTLITSPGNETKVQIIKYQVPIPSAGPIYNEYKTDADARRSYYQSQASIFAPSSRHDGIVYQGTYPGHAAYLNQKRIDSVSALPSAFAISVVGNWSKNNDSLMATVKVTATSAYNEASANLKLHVAFVQSLEFATAPGTNGEKVFENVVRKMYPSASGTPIAATWTANQTQTFEIKGAKPAHIKPSDHGYWVVFIQNDANKRVLQAARSNGDAFPTSIEEMNKNLFNNMAIYPNPATDMASVRLTLNEAAKVQINVTDVVGRIVYTVAPQQLTAGTHNMNIATSNFTPGVYNVTISSEAGSITQRLTVSK